MRENRSVQETLVSMNFRNETVSPAVKRTEHFLTSTDAPEEVWEKVAESLETFVDAWEQSNVPPSLSDFAPQGPPQTRRLALVEMVKVDLEYRWQRQQEPLRLEEYATRFRDLVDAEGLPADLIYEEYNIRRRGGEQVAPEEYFQRFPKQSEQLRHLLGLSSPEVTTSLAWAKRPMGLRPGDQIDDFDLLAELGSGAFATVFLARQLSLQRIVALKVSGIQGHEPQTLAQLDHPHIGRVYDQRVLSDQNLRLLYMKYVPGGTLEDAIKQSRETPAGEKGGKTILAAVDGALDRRGEEPPLESSARTSLASCDWPTTVCRIGTQLAEALDYAHGLGVLHRDLKPANILLTAEGSPQLVDFNISFCSKLDGATPTAYFGGSLAYMSPEQLEASNPCDDRTPDSLDGRSDIYSLGIVLWEMLTGRRPFRDEAFTGNWPQTLEQMVARRLSGPDPHDLAELPVEVPRPICQILLRCLAAARGQRPACAAELADELRLCMLPEAYRLLRPAANSLVVASRRWALVIMLFLAVLPNALAGWFNYVYNRDQIVARLQDSQDLFWNVQAAINGVAFPVGLILLAAAYLPVVRAVNGGGASHADQHGCRLRARCLHLGQTAALIGTAEWLIAGLAYPLGMNAAGVRLTAGDYVHFLISLALCGIIAATYPFFGITAYAVHCLYPSLLSRHENTMTEAERLRRCERKLWFFLAMGFLLPMLAVVLLVTFGSDHDRTALGILSAGSLIGCCWLFWAARRIHLDLATLREAITTL